MARCARSRGYTHKLIVPHAVRLEAARAYMEGHRRQDRPRPGHQRRDELRGRHRQVHGSGCRQCRGRRRSRPTAGTATPGPMSWRRSSATSGSPRSTRAPPEIMEMTIARERWQQHLKTQGRYYQGQGTAGSAVCRRQPPHRRRRYRGAGPPRAGHRPRGVLHRSADPQPARPVPHRRVHRLHRDGRRSPPPRRRSTAPAREEPQPVHRRRARRDVPGVRPRGRAEGRPRRVLLVAGAAEPAHLRSRPSTAIPTAAILAAQAGLVTDMNYVADVLYGRLDGDAVASARTREIR